MGVGSGGQSPARGQRTGRARRLAPPWKFSVNALDFRPLPIKNFGYANASVQ